MAMPEVILINQKSQESQTNKAKKSQVPTPAFQYRNICFGQPTDEQSLTQEAKSILE